MMRKAMKPQGAKVNSPHYQIIPIFKAYRPHGRSSHELTRSQATERFTAWPSAQVPLGGELDHRWG